MPSIPSPSRAEWPFQRIKPGKNSRHIVVDDGIRELHQSILRDGLLQPLLVIDQEIDNLIAGFRRLTAISLGGIDKVPVLVYPPSITPTQRLTINGIENLQRVDLTDQQIFGLCKDLLALNPEWQRQDLAKQLSKDPSMVTRYMSPSDLIPEALEAFMAGKFGFSKAYAIAKSPDQQETLRLTLGGATRDEIERQARKKRGAGTPTVRASKIKVPLVSGPTVVITGDDISLEEAIEAASEAVKQMKAAVAKGLNAKTAMNVWKDIAAAG
jgi:ParB/RepB/Spo0J family partition protein